MTKSQKQYCIASQLFVQRIKDTNTDHIDDLEEGLATAKADLEEGKLDRTGTQGRIQNIEKDLEEAKLKHLGMVTDEAQRACDEAKTFIMVFDQCRMSDS